MRKSEFQGVHQLSKYLIMFLFDAISPTPKPCNSASRTATTFTTTALAMGILSRALEFSLMISSSLDLVMALFESGGKLN